MFPVRKEFEYDPRYSFSQFNPYDVAFCYPHPLYDRPFIVKGGHQAIRDYLKKMDVPMVVHHTLYQKGRHRILYGFYGLDKGIQINKRFRYNKALQKYLVSKYYELISWNYGSGKPKKVLAKFKRGPRRWIREINLYVKMLSEPEVYHAQKMVTDMEELKEVARDYNLCILCSGQAKHFKSDVAFLEYLYRSCLCQWCQEK